MPAGQMRDATSAAASHRFNRTFAHHVLAFSDDAASHFADIIAEDRRADRPIDVLNGLITAAACASATSIAHRDTGGFTGCGLTVLDPWQGL